MRANIKQANDIPPLIESVRATADSASVKAAVQALKLFFVDASQDGDLAAARSKVEEVQFQCKPGKE